MTVGFADNDVDDIEPPLLPNPYSPLPSPCMSPPHCARAYVLTHPRRPRPRAPLARRTARRTHPFHVPSPAHERQEHAREAWARPRGRRGILPAAARRIDCRAPRRERAAAAAAAAETGGRQTRRRRGTARVACAAAAARTVHQAAFAAYVGPAASTEARMTCSQACHSSSIYLVRCRCRGSTLHKSSSAGMADHACHFQVPTNMK
jgi:hypothetical protein